MDALLRLDAVGTSAPTLHALAGRPAPPPGPRTRRRRYWSGDVHELERLREVPNICSSAYLLPPTRRFPDGNVDLSRLWENTLTASRPTGPSPSSRTDTQPGLVPG